MLALLAVVLFLGAAGSVLVPLDGPQIGTLFPLLVGIVYLQLGIWSGGWRIAAVGLVVMAAALFAYHGPREHFDLLMACAGGGALIAGGLWMRRL